MNKLFRFVMRVPFPHMKKLQQIAKKKIVSVNSLIREAIEQYLGGQK